MTKSKTLYEREGERDLAAVAAFLHELADQMAAGTLSLGDKNGGKALHLPEEVELEVTLEREKKKSKRARYSLEIELAWKAAKKAREAEPAEDEDEAGGEDVGKTLHLAADEASRVKAETEANLPNAEPAAEEIKGDAEAVEQEAAEAPEEEPSAEMEEASAAEALADVEAAEGSGQEIPLLENPDRPLLDAGEEG